MTSRRCLHVALLAVSLVLVVRHAHADGVASIAMDEPSQAKGKLERAERRVTDLISKLDSVSDQATKAKNEIHSTLKDLWHIVDLLGQDKCGEVVEKIRTAQRRAESQVAEHSVEVKKLSAMLEKRTKEVAKKDDTLAENDKAIAERGATITSLQSQLSEVRAMKEKADGENKDMKEKLKNAFVKERQSEAYKLVAKRLDQLNAQIGERAETLSRIQASVKESRSGHEDWTQQIENIAEMVRNAENIGGDSNKMMDSLRSKVAELEKSLREAVSSHAAALTERNTLQSEVENLQGRISAATGKSMERPFFLQKNESTSWVGVGTLCFLSLCTGAVGVFLLNVWQQSGKDLSAGSNGADKQTTTTPTATRPSPSFHQSKVSPYGGSSGNRDPGSESRGGTPRAY